jgi:hypothetical protein
LHSPASFPWPQHEDIPERLQTDDFLQHQAAAVEQRTPFWQGALATSRAHEHLHVERRPGEVGAVSGSTIS